MLSAIHIHHWKSIKLAVICVLNSASVNVHACKIHALVKTPVKDHTVLQSYAEKKILERCADLAMQNIFKVCETDKLLHRVFYISRNLCLLKKKNVRHLFKKTLLLVSAMT